MNGKRITGFRFVLIISILFFRSVYSESSTEWIKAGYWYSGSELPVSDINSALFTHLLFSFAHINSSTYELHIDPSSTGSFSSFTDTVKKKNPEIKTLLSIYVGQEITEDSLAFSLMLNQSSSWNLFIRSSIKTARVYGFSGLELFWVMPDSISDVKNFNALLEDWRKEVTLDARNSRKPELILALTTQYPDLPVQSIEKNLDWVHLAAYDYNVPTNRNFTGLHSALRSPEGRASVESGIEEWLKRGLPSKKLVLGLPYHGYAWKLLNPTQNFLGARASGPAITADGSIGYKSIKSFVLDYGYGSVPTYNSTVGSSLFTSGATWINFDGPKSIKAKISYAKETGLLGFCVFQLSNDDRWELSITAQGEDQNDKKKLQLIISTTSIFMVFFLLLTIVSGLKRKTIVSKAKLLYKSIAKASSAVILDNGARDLLVFSFSTINSATENFSDENKIAEGGYGPVYKGKLKTGEEIAVKRLSRTSHQGQEEFNNEVGLSAMLQHVNLVKVLGICIEKEEKMLVYEYMPNKSLDFYLFYPERKHLLDWGKRVSIIEGVIQGLLYLQEYSNFTIVHRDLKANNILLDNSFKPKISDFGTAKLFTKYQREANTDRIVGTYGFVPPEYLKRGAYSMKYDVYSFGVVLLQIISGNTVGALYGPDENLNLLQYAYELWKEGNGKDFFDKSLEDSASPLKLMNCMEVALLCVQEDPQDRPSILDVYTLLLTRESAEIPCPKRPAFANPPARRRSTTSDIMPNNNCSNNDLCITQLIPR